MKEIGEMSYTYYCSDGKKGLDNKVVLRGCYTVTRRVVPGYHVAAKPVNGNHICGQTCQSIVPGDGPGYLPIVPNAKNPRLSANWAPYKTDAEAAKWLQQFRVVKAMEDAVTMVATDSRFALAVAYAKAEDAVGDEHAVGAWDALIEVLDVADDAVKVLVASMPPNTAELEYPIDRRKDDDNAKLENWHVKPAQYKRIWALRQAYAIVRGLAKKIIV